MSASRCFRCALEAARPAKRIQIQAQPLIQSRTYAHPSAGPNAKKSGSEIKSPIPEAPVAHPSAEQLQQQAPQRPVPRTPIATSVTGDDASNHASAPEPQNAERSSGTVKPYPPNVLAAFRTPYKHKRTHGIPVASLQLRSYSVRNLEFFADFALRVAYYLKLPASGPVPLPKKTERWTMPKSNFVHKKSQENFERITLRRMITIYDGHPDVVEIWLAALRRWQFYGVGMKANVWQFEGLDVAAKLDKQAVVAEKELDAKLANFGWNSDVAGKKSIEEMLRRQGGNTSGAPMMEVRDEIQGAKNIDLFRDVK